MTPTESDRVVVYNLRKRKEIQNLSKAFTEQIPSTLGILVETNNLGKRSKLNFFQNSILDIVCFCLSRLVRVYPKINSRYQNEKSYLEIDCMDIGIAFDNGSNLKVLGIPDAAKHSLEGIQVRILEMLDLYESNETIHPQDFANTITVTDLTEMDIALVVPTLSSEQSMILSINKHSKSGYLITCTYDHRIMEGYYVSEFLSALKTKILEVLKVESDPQEEISCGACQRTLSEEIALNSNYRGLIVLKNANHSEVLLCRVCFEGW
jgi:pyruvate/2-oxoglutarate dehydrogenase complex dihydrolipoamide acyltransferase (E2) component